MKLKSIIFFYVLILGILLFHCNSYSEYFCENNYSKITVFSQNEKFRIEVIPFIESSDSINGISYVYKVDDSIPIYSINRKFLTSGSFENRLFINNDGRSVCFVNGIDDPNNKDNKTINFFRDGKLIKNYTKNEIFSCNPEFEDCYLFYYFRNSLPKSERNGDYSHYFKDTTIGYKNCSILKNNYSELIRFASLFESFISYDTIYLITAKLNVLIFDITNGILVKEEKLENILGDLKFKASFYKCLIEPFEYPDYQYRPNLKSGKTLNDTIANFFEMKIVNPDDTTEYEFRKYDMKISYFIDRYGAIDNISIDSNSSILKYKNISSYQLISFIKTLKFEKQPLPNFIEKWHYQNYYYFRNKSNTLAIKEAELLRKINEENYKKRLLLDSIGGIYIPKDLDDCYRMLDTLLATKLKKK